MRRAATSRSIVANVGWNVLAKCLVFALKFVSIPILARLLTPQEFGVSVHQALTWFGLFTLLAFLPCLAMEWGRIYLQYELGPDRRSEKPHG